MHVEISIHAIQDFFLEIQSKLHSAAANGSWVGVWLLENMCQAQKMSGDTELWRPSTWKFSEWQEVVMAQKEKKAWIR